MTIDSIRVGAGRLINVYSHGFHQSVAHVCSGARDRQLLVAKVAHAFLRTWSDSMGVMFASPLVRGMRVTPVGLTVTSLSIACPLGHPCTLCELS
jgi:hypothetical protein